MTERSEQENGTFQKVFRTMENDEVVFRNGNAVLVAKPLTVVRALTSTGGARVLATPPFLNPNSDEFDSCKTPMIEVKDEPQELEKEVKTVSVDSQSAAEDVVYEERRSMLSFDDFLKSTNTQVASVDESLKSLESADVGVVCEMQESVKVESVDESLKSMEVEPPIRTVEEVTNVDVACETQESVRVEPVGPVCAEKQAVSDDEVEVLKVVKGKQAVSDDVRVLKVVKKEVVEEKKILIPNLDDGDFPVEPGWSLLGSKVETATSMAKGVRRLVDNEIVYFNFPNPQASYKFQWIVRVSTKRSGVVGRLPMEWAKSVIPLVQSGNVKVRGRCVAAPVKLETMQEIYILVSFYAHNSLFAECVDTSWRLEACGHINSAAYPLFTLLNMLGIEPYRKADFTPEEMKARKRVLKLDSDEALVFPVNKRRKAAEPLPQPSEDEQALSESALNKLIGAAEVFDLEEKEAPKTLMCSLKPYQSQALYWMTEIEKGGDDENAEKNLHPCWSAYNLCHGKRIYVNIFTGEAAKKFPQATQMARGGILADAMGLGKTVMTIALILSNTGRMKSEDSDAESIYDNIFSTKRRNVNPYNVEGGTLIVCPMALLGQWKDELETHSKPGSISIFVHYGGGRTTNPDLLLEYDVVLTTYGVLSAAFKSEGENSIYHRVKWYRVVLDEAHHIKSHKSQVAAAAIALSSHCRWCLTGTPLQNSLEDLFSLLSFLRVEPWCNWQWWTKLIQKPYEQGDQRALKLVKGILRTLMLRRTKETKDKEGRPILVLPPTDIQLIECEQSESERDFYDALFLRSKVQFEQYVAQGKVLNHYANILDLLMQLRRCCNHPFLVMSGSDPAKYADLSRLARKFLESHTESSDMCCESGAQQNAELNKLASLACTFLQNSDSASHSVQSRGYIDEVLGHIQKGETVECSICMESPDDPVFTPCAHQFCRECLFNCWGTSMGGKCPICRQSLKKSDLIALPTESPFKVDIENNLTESSKLSKLFDFLEKIQKYSDEKSIVFSQWTSFFNLLENPLRRRGIGFLRFDGKLTQKQRESVLKEFNNTKEKRVLLMSLKAGGVGLNLTAASNVFLMDPWWNPAVEEQAIMRIHRIGQKRKVTVRRFIVKGTVEDRLQQVQAKKQKMISGALTDDEVRTSRIQDLKMLFS
ncbi:DNA repair protein RAD5B-like isoform X2 [Trifolium pratense]|uniref:DNA repair protein RAD5B-like isoform X2 n=1 Tax=Trifolium pratense TaxID=57577 RepID=UPI001E693A9D|nr:DNA repair protein RAD5B-like isoform X2 [Trifolium pratense]